MPPVLRTLPVVLLLAACGGPRIPQLIVLPDGRQAYSIRANSGPFMVGRISEEKVITDFVHDNDVCPNNFDIVSKNRLDPNNYSLVIVDAVVACR